MKNGDRQRDHDILNLLPGKKGMLKTIFSRAGLMILLMMLQIVIFVSVYHWFADYFTWFALVQWVFSFTMVIYLFNCGMDSSGKLTWLTLIVLFPIPATITLWFTRRSIGHRLITWRFRQLIEESRDLAAQDEAVSEREELRESGTDDLSRYLCRSGAFPVFEGTRTEYFPSGEAVFEAILESLKKAERFIFMEYFIIDEGYMWGRVLKVLAEKAAQGVDVRVMYDGMCEVNLLPHDYPKRMAALGIRCKPFSPITPFISTHYNYRDHRKILVVDGRTAFSGGVNFADEYINRIDRFGHWKDAAIQVTGKAVRSFTLMFLQMWNIDEQEPRWDECRVSCRAENDGFVIPYGDSPLDQDRVGEMVYMDILNRAKSYVHIMTPYLILDDEMMTSLKYAAQRGVDVRIILPGIPDKKAPYALAKSHYRALIEAGVKLYEYTPGFVHSKVFVSDDEKAVVGTINLDYRSLYHHFECATYLYRTSCIRDICADFEETFGKCREVTEETIRAEKFGYKVMGILFKWIAPLI